MSIKQIFPSAALPEAEGGKGMWSKKKDGGKKARPMHWGLPLHDCGLT